MTERPEPTRYGEAIWLEPFPDVLLEGIPDQAPGPEARYETKEAIELGSSSDFSICLRPSARCSSSATCSATAPKRSPRCWRRPHNRSTACCAAPARHSSRGCRPPDANGRPCQLQTRARDRRPLRRRDPNRRH